MSKLSNIHVDIAMATYNGQAYIAEQIKSILQQTHCNFTLYISDDGSSDKTIEIIKELSLNDERIQLVHTERVGGVIKNFERVLSCTTSKYIFLSDQDDVWKYNKIEKYLNFYLSEETYDDEPLLLFSDLELVNERLDSISPSFYAATKLNPYRNFHIENLLWMNSVWGCTVMMNRKVLEYALPFFEPIMMHDHWLALNALKNGRLIYLNERLIKYRQHDNNVLGGTGYQQKFIHRALNIDLYKNIRNKAKVVSKMQGSNNFIKRLVFSKTIVKSMKNCETIKFPLLFLTFYLIFG